MIMEASVPSVVSTILLSRNCIPRELQRDTDKLGDGDSGDTSKQLIARLVRVNKLLEGAEAGDEDTEFLLQRNP